MSLAEETREAVRNRPFLRESLRAGVLNYTAAARFLVGDVDAASGDEGIEAIAAALRRYRESLPDYDEWSRDARVAMESRLGSIESSDDALLTVGDESFGPNSGSLTGVVANGAVDAAALARVLARLLTADVVPVAAGGADGSLVVVVERIDGPNAIRAVENALERAVTPLE